MRTLSRAELLGLFGAEPDEWQECHERLAAAMDLRYRPVTGGERDQLILRIMKRIDSPALPVSGRERQPDWEKGWGENLQDFIDSGYDVEKLVPKYFKKNVPIRLLGDYVLPEDPDFVLNFTRLFRAWLFDRYLADYGSVYEFGCGPATHLAWLAERYPGKRLYGLDWARPSQEIIRLLAEKRGWNIGGRHFDFFNPDPALHLEPGSAVFTFGALEQIGDRHGAFLDYLLRQKPGICVNVECILEFYDEELLPDYLAACYHRHKNYLAGYYSRLRELAGEGVVEIIASHHKRFGNLFDDSHSYVVWRPVA